MIAVLALLATGCAHRGVRMKHHVAVVTDGDFLDFPGKYRGRLVRLVDVDVARIEMVRPLVFVRSDRPTLEIVAHDPRGLARRYGLAVGQRATIRIECTEGRSDRGNVLVEVERAETVAPTVP